MGADSEDAESRVRDRIYELPDDTPTDVLVALEEFTIPCRLCVAGAREMGVGSVLLRDRGARRGLGPRGGRVLPDDADVVDDET
jgi:hypothetical protein